MDLSKQEQSLLGKVESSKRALGSLKQNLEAVEGELGELSKHNQEYDLLSDICRSLEELQNRGAGNLFWDGVADDVNPEDTLKHARHKLDAFGNTLAQVQERRQSIIEEIGGQNETLQFLHSDLLDAMEEEEKRKYEWKVEREVGNLYTRNQIMPWARGCEEDERFRRSLAGSFLAAIVLGLLVSVIDLPIQDISTIIEVPERVARLVREERKLPPPPPVEEQILAEEEPLEPEPVEVQPPDEVVPEAVEQPVVAEAAQPKTREQVKSKGILAFRDSFAKRANLRPTTQLGSQARVSSAGENAVGRPERSMVTSSAPGSSGGINLAAISRDVGGGGGQGIGGVEVGQVASSIGGAEGASRPLSGGASAGRTDEEIQIVFDRYKASLYRLYNRELRKNPTLRGQLTLRLTIEPDGSVSMCQLQASSMEAPALAQQVVGRVGTFDFGAKEGIVAMTIIYPIDFLPAG
ncbi:MAG: AgmX/PglI C-terminal domain-containing protein [Gammaproteobacteria bacterium]